MNKAMKMSALALAIYAPLTFAHHPAEDIVDPDIYAHIDAMVADTPHADLTFDEMGGGRTDTTITFDSVADMEDMIADENLMEYVELLDGVVDVSIGFNPDRSVTLTISQTD